MNDMGYGFKAYPCDVADYDSCKACVEVVTKDLGPIDILVNNAGITRDMTFKKMSKADWDAVIHTNLDSCFNMTKQVMDGMIERGWGRVINISSVNGQKGAFGQTNYSAAKAGMHGFTKALALEVAKKGVTVNTISPGYIGTKMVMAIPQEVLDSKILPQIPMSRLGKPEEIAGLVAYLVLRGSGFRDGCQHFDQRRPAHVLTPRGTAHGLLRGCRAAKVFVAIGSSRDGQESGFGNRCDGWSGNCDLQVAGSKMVLRWRRIACRIFRRRTSGWRR